jgi:NAD(P)H-hydrate repair Nnr-like enzyme with NAD(P)H-hydrate dehydratase domain
VVLKGARTLVVTPSGDAYRYEEGSIGLATSGSGDTLAGIIGGLAARGAATAQAAVWAVMSEISR